MRDRDLIEETRKALEAFNKGEFEFYFDQKNRLYDTFSWDSDLKNELVFHELLPLLSNTLEEIYLELQVISNRDKEKTNNQAFEIIDNLYPFNWIFEEVEDLVTKGRLDLCFFSDVNKNTQLIKIICKRIESFPYFNRYTDLEIDTYLFRGDKEILNKPFDISLIMNYYIRTSQKLILSFKNFFVPELLINHPLKHEVKIQQKSDNRKSIYAPTNNERLKALKEFCPEFIDKLHKSNLNKNEQGQIINLITGVNKTDAYKKIITSDSKVLDNTIIKNDEIDFENLKSKLNNT